MLEIVKEIKKYTLEQTVKKYGLLHKKAYCDKCKSYSKKIGKPLVCLNETPHGDVKLAHCESHKFLLKYSQIESAPFKAVEAVRECRGLILTNDLEVLSLPFKRFFNIEESVADIIDLLQAYILKKEDGSVVGLYYDPILFCWCVQTSGTPEANTNVGDYKKSFADLFWEVFETYGTGVHLLDENKVYVFELCTKYNQVVAIHETAKLVLLNVRNREEMTEASYPELIQVGKQIGIPAVEAYDLNSEEEIRALFDTLTKEDEGFVAVMYDPIKKSNIRVKLKNPKYVIAHRSETNFHPKHLFKILQDNEQDEFLGVLTRFKDQYYRAEHFWLKLIYEANKLSEIGEIVTLKAVNKKDFVFQMRPLITPLNQFYITTIYRTFEYYVRTGEWHPQKPEEILKTIEYKKLHDMFNQLYDNMI